MIRESVFGGKIESNTTMIFREIFFYSNKKRDGTGSVRQKKI